MPEGSSASSDRPIINFNSPKAPPTILTIGALLWRFIAYWEDVDFILSIREEKIAMTLQLLLDWGWLILALVGIFWILGAHKAPADASKVHWGMVIAVGILAFMTGALVTVRAVGSSPIVLAGWGGDPTAKNCNGVIDTARLVSLQHKYKLVLMCGVSDPSHDPIEDDKIAVSSPFTITGQLTSIVAPYGAMEVELNQLPQVQGSGFNLWHSVAVLPNDVNTSEIKRVSDIEKRGGKILTEPKAGAFGSPQPLIPIVPPLLSPSNPLPKKKA